MSVLSPFIPKFIKNRYDNHVRNKFYKLWYESQMQSRVEIDSQIPKYELAQKHIDQLKILLNREDLLAHMPRHAICAELGVDKGEFSELILKITEPQQLHLIDLWGDESRYHDGLKLSVEEKFKEQISKGQLKVNIGLSTEVLKKFEDYFFDWVYIDTAHTYEVTAAELKLLKKKLKPGGIIAGHDYVIGNWAAGFRYGVIEAVHEFCVKENWEFIYLTFETHQHRSFAIKQITSLVNH
jgi:hypothetical protein